MAWAPLAALAIAVTYLHGYWKVFGIFPLPYLSVQQMLSYAAIPFFGNLIAVGVGYFLSWIGPQREVQYGPDGRRAVGWVDVMTVVLFGAGVIALFFDVPGAVLLTVVGGSGAACFQLIDRKSFWERIHGRERLAFLLMGAIVFAAMSWAQGREDAHWVRRLEEPDAVVLIAGSTEEVRWIGTLGDRVFYLNGERRVIMRPTSEVQRVMWKKTYPASDAILPFKDR